MIASVTLALFHRSSPLANYYGLETAKDFSLGAAGGFLLAGLIFVLLFVKNPPSYQSEKVKSVTAVLGVCCIVTGVLLFVSKHDVVVEMSPFICSISGILAGFGAAASLFTCYVSFPSKESEPFLRNIIHALTICVLTSALLLIVPAKASTALLLFILLFGTAFLVYSATKKQATFNNHRDDTANLQKNESLSHRCIFFLKKSWKPLAGTGICAFIVGFTWDTDLMGIPLNDTLLVTSEKTIGLAIAAILLHFLAKRCPSNQTETVLLFILLPISLLSFIARPYFLGTDFPPIGLLVWGVARELGFALFFTASWRALCVKPRETAVAGGILYGIVCTFLASATLMGFYSAVAFGASINMVGAILFSAYLASIVTSSAIEMHRSQKEISTQSLDELLAEHSRKVGTEYGLTPRECEILSYLSLGHSYSTIAESLFISENTVRTHARNIYRKVGVASRSELVSLLHSKKN